MSESTQPPSCTSTHIGSVGIGDTNDLASQGSRQAHSLGTLVHSNILPTPVHHSHLHKVVQDPISKDHGITSSEFLHNVNHIPPEAVIKVTLIEDVFGPKFLIEPLFPREVCSIQHPGIDLTNHQFPFNWGSQ